MRNRETRLGCLHIEVAGQNHYNATLEQEEPVRLEREPDNPHDPNAIRVLNAAGEAAGYVPRQVAGWLAPLIAREMIRLHGHCAEGPGTDSGARLSREGELRSAARERIWDRDPRAPARLSLEVFALPNGRHILQPSVPPPDAQSALHAKVAEVFKDAQTRDAAFIQSMASMLASLTEADCLPETLLLIALLSGPSRSQAGADPSTSAAKASEALAAMRIGDPVACGGLSFFPLIAAGEVPTPSMLLQDAVKQGLAEVREVDESGHVPVLVVENRGDMPLLIPEGDILVGAKQDRVVNITVIVAVRSRIKLPVSCVEAGRWRSVSRAFDVRYSAPPSLRRVKTQSVQRSRREGQGFQSDQGEVWRCVGEHLEAGRVESRTNCLSDLFSAQERAFQKPPEPPSMPQDAAGFVAAGPRRTLGMEVFESPAMFQQAWPRLFQSYYVEHAAAQVDAAQPVDAHRELAQRFLEKVRQSIRPAPSQAGHGDELSVEGQGLAGAGVWFDGALRHLAAFAGK